MTAPLSVDINNSPTQAISAARQEVAIQYYLAAVTEFNNGKSGSALNLLNKAIISNPGFYEAHYFLGMIQGCCEEYESAASHLHNALACNPNSAAASQLLGKAYCHLNQHSTGVVYLRKAVELAPDSTEAACALALAYSSLGEPGPAQRVLEHHCTYGDNRPLANFTLALLLTPEYPEQALIHYEQALTLKPDYHEAGLNYAVLLLSRGNFETGWAAYEHRIPWLGLNCELEQLPRWRGEPLTGKSILVVTEQGFGDSIQFIRYARMLKQRGATVYVLCTNNQPLRTLLASAPGVDGTLGPKEPTPQIDCYIPLLSLPLLFDTRLDTIPPDIGYLTAERNNVLQWQKRLQEFSGLKIGVVWAGGRLLKSNVNRSIPLTEFSRLFSVANATFFSLQVGPDALTHAELTTYGTQLIDLTGAISDFSDTAALITNLDLVISVDTAVAHLAGALGKPVWTLLYHPPEWRWLQERSNTPWYPTMTLFRQHDTMLWSTVLDEVQSTLEALIRRFSPEQPIIP